VTRAPVLLAALLAACTYGRPAHEGAEARAWSKSLARSVRSGKVYDRLESRAFAGAIYLSVEVRRQRAGQVAAWQAMTAAERDALLRREAAEAEQYEEFHLSFYTPDEKDNELDTRRSTWRVALVVPGEGESLPAEVRRLPADAQVRELYPFVGAFDTVYRVRFPRWKGAPLDGRPFLLRVAGAAGQVDLDFGAPQAAKPGP